MKHYISLPCLLLLAVVLSVGWSVVGSPKAATAQVLYKRCGQCFRAVEMHYQIYDRCPFCEVTWLREEDRTVPYPGYPYPGEYHPTKPTPSYWKQRRWYELSRRERQRERVRVNTAAARESYCPDAQAQNHVAAAIRCERHGKIRMAIAYYNLVLRYCPETNMADVARAAVARLSAG